METSSAIARQIELYRTYGVDNPSVSLDRAAELVGVHVNTLRNDIKAGKLVVYRPGENVVRVSVDDLAEYVVNLRSKPSKAENETALADEPVLAGTFVTEHDTKAAETSDESKSSSTIPLPNKWTPINAKSDWHLSHNANVIGWWPTVLDFLISEDGFAIYNTIPQSGISICLSPDNSKIFFKVKARLATEKSLKSISIRMLPAVRLRGDSQQKMESKSYVNSAWHLFNSSVEIGKLSQEEVDLLSGIPTTSLSTTSLDMDMSERIRKFPILAAITRFPPNLADLNVTPDMVVYEQRIEMPKPAIIMPSPLTPPLTPEGLAITLSMEERRGCLDPKHKLVYGKMHMDAPPVVSKFELVETSGASELKWPVRIYLEWE